MSVITRTVTINAAFLQEIKEDNQRLRQVLDELRDKDARWRLSARDLAHLLGQLRDQLATHFALEEAFGYFEDPLRVAPHLGERAEDLRSQHGALYSKASRLAEVADARARRTGELTSRLVWSSFEAFDAVLLQHESAENELIMQAFNVDIGVGD